MPDPVFGFPAPIVQRIRAAVVAYERTPTDMTGPPNSRQPSDYPDGWWAKIGTFTAVSSVNHYAWTQQRETLTGFDDMPSGMSGTTTTQFAINDAEVAGLSVASVVGTPPIVWMRYVWAWDSGGSKWTRAFRFKYVGPTIHAKITVATAINGGIRWKYTLRIGHWDMTSSPSTGGAWVDDSGGSDSTGWNSAEDMNTFTSGTGAIGTGNTNVSQSNGTVNGGSCALVSLPVGAYVAIMPRGVAPHYTIVNAMNSAQ